MTVYSTLLELIDMRSFSSLWYWVFLSATWTVVSHRLMGAPLSVYVHASKNGGADLQELEYLTAMKSARILAFWQKSGWWALGGICFSLTALGLLGFVYQLEMAQAVFLLVAPLCCVGGVRYSTAQRINTQDAQGIALLLLLKRHRSMLQLLSTVSIFVTFLWGMFYNLSSGPLSG